MSNRLDESEQGSLLALLRVRGLGPVKFKRIYESFGSFSEILRLSNPVLQTMTLRENGYFGIPIPSYIKEYSIGLRIEQAEGCPERFKKHVPKPKPKKPIHL